jgi:alcohol dehydrogenase, propanol-preferring
LLSQQAPLLPLVVVYNALTIQGNYYGTQQSLRECLDLVAKGAIKPSIETGTIEDAAKVIKDLDEGKVKSRMVLLPTWTR